MPGRDARATGIVTFVSGKRVLPEPPSTRGRTSRVARNIGAVSGLIAQLLLALLGLEVVNDSLDNSPDLLMLLWCILGTGYALVMVVALWIDSRDESGHRPTRLQANPLVRWTSLIASLVSGLVGLFASFLIMFGGADEETTLIYKVAGVWAIVVAWALIQWGFAQYYYAHYYAAETPPLEFPGTPIPDLVDFAYFSFTIGTTFATTDVMILSRRQRWRVTIHSVITFFFNSAILVLALNSFTST